MGRQGRPTKGEPFSIRLSTPTELYVDAEARRTRRSRSAVVEDLTEEAARTRRFPGIGFREGGDGTRSAWVTGSGFYVWMLIEALQDFGSMDSLLAAYDHLAKRHVELAVAYYREYAAEIDAAIAENRRPLQERRLLYPFIQVEYVDNKAGAAHPA